VGRRQGLHALQFLKPALRLLGLGGLVAKSTHKIIDFDNAPLLFLKIGLLVCQSLCSHPFEVRIVTLIGKQLLLLDMQYAFTGRIDKVAVMGDHQQGAGVLLQPLLQPQCGIQVQVIGGFIQ